MSLQTQVVRQINNQIVHGNLNAFIAAFKKSNLSQEEHSAKGETWPGNDPSISEIDGELIAVKDNICTQHEPTTCGSAILDGFHSPYVADVVRRLKDAGAIIAGKTNLDEFGMGSNSTHSHHGAVGNAYAQYLSAGGSSGGSAVAVATDQCFAALGTDTGGSVRLPAAYNGVIGFKPSYGAISRWGVVAYANSLDTVGILAKNVAVVRKVYHAITLKDQQDPTLLSYATQPRRKPLLDERERSDSKRLRVGVPYEYNTQELQPLVREAWSRTLQDLQSAGHLICPISLPATKSALSAYYVLAPAEASSNLAKYDGARYGKCADDPTSSAREEGSVLFSRTRGQGLGDEVRRRILLGAYSLSAGAIDNYFIQAQRIRRLVQKDFDDVFAAANPLRRSGGQDVYEAIDNKRIQHYDVAVESSCTAKDQHKVDYIIVPTAQSLPPTLEQVQQRDHVDAYSTDVLTVPASLAGLPAISIPVPVPKGHEADAGPVAKVGMQIIGQIGTDDDLLQAARLVEQLDRSG